MKKLIMVLLVLMLPGQVLAKDFWDNLDYAVTAGENNVKYIDAELFGARATGSWLDTNNNNELDDNESIIGNVNLYDRSGTLALSTPGSVSTRDAIEAWAEAHADEIMDILFQGSISGSSSGISGDQLTGDVLVGNVMFPSKARRTVASKGAVNEKPQIDSFRSAFTYNSLKVNGDSGSAYSLLLGYVDEINENLEMGFYLPYRYSTIDDDINTESHYLGCLIYAKQKVKSWDKMQTDLNVGIDIFGSGYVAETDAIDYVGNLKYGGGLFTTVEKNFQFGLLTLGCDYKISKAYIKSSWISSDNEFVKEAIDWVNNLDPVHTITYGANLQIPFDNASISTEVYRSNFISNDIDDDRDSQTTVGLNLTYYVSDTFEIDLGVKGVFELVDVDIYGINFGTILRF